MPHVRVDESLEMFYEDHYFGPPWLTPEPVLLVHGVAESSAAWYAWVPFLSPHFRVLRIDQRGFGRSSIPNANYPWSIAGFATDIARFLDAMKLDRAHVVAAKLGGTIALQFAADHPDRVSSLSVVSSPVRGLGHTSDPKLMAVTHQLASIGVRAWAEGTQRMRLGTTVSGEHVSYWNDLMAASDNDTCINVEAMCNHMDITGQLPEITAPTLVITMAAGAMQTPADVLAWTRLIPRSRVITIEGDGYHPAASRPDECAGHVLQFIQQHSGPNARTEPRMSTGLHVRPLCKALGVEVLGVDLGKPVTPDFESELRRLLDSYQVLLFRNQDISVSDQIRTLKMFGKVSDETHDGSFHTFVSNVLPDGLFGDHELIYHSDFAFGEYQPPVISLYATDVGPAAGPTSFVNCTRACTELPADLREAVEGKTMVQIARFAGGNSAATTDNRSKMLGLRDLPPDSSFRMSRHPVLKPHPRTGVPLLFASVKHTSHIEGIGQEESDRLVKALLASLYTDDNTYTHHWKNGDLLIWDNVATQHARPALKGGGAEQRRTLRRVLVSEKTAREMLGDATYGTGD